MNKLLAICCSFISLTLLQGCESLPTETTTTDTPNIAPTAVSPQPVPVNKPIEYRSFPTDTLYSLLVAELAASRQDFELTLERYVEQAYLTNDNAVIARAARIAQFFRSHQSALDMGLLWTQHEPNNLEANTLVANAYLELKQPILSLDYTERFLKQLPPEVLSGASAFTETIANASKRSDKKTLTQLTGRYQALSALYPTLASPQIGLSVLLQASGNSSAALAAIQQALTLEPNKASAITQEIILLQQNQHTDVALAKLKILLEQQPNNNRLRLLYARLLTETDLNEAYQQFTLLSEESPKQSELAFSRAILAAELGKTDIAKALFLGLQKDNYQPDTIHFYLGRIDESLKQLPSALTHYLSVAQGDNYLPSRNRAARVLITQGKVNEAQQLFAQLREQLPTQRDTLYLNESNLLMIHEYDSAALTLLHTAINEYPNNTALRYNRSTIYEKQDRIDLMEQDFRHVLSIEPNNTNALNGLGYFLATRTKRYDEAYQLIEKALSLSPNDPAIMDSLGWAAFKLGRLDEATAHLQKAFTLYPDPEIAAHLGEVLWTKGQKQAAKDIWKNNLEENPEAAIILETLQRLGVSL
jgi:tetratricopeptide (TPR) repeat protein